MLLIPCPYCGKRPEIEFTHGGEAHLTRAAKPADLGDQAWTDFLYMRANTKGVYAERWRHAHGCGRFFNALRDTTTDHFLATYEAGQPRPSFPAAAVPGAALPRAGSGVGAAAGAEVMPGSANAPGAAAVPDAALPRVGSGVGAVPGAEVMPGSANAPGAAAVPDAALPRAGSGVGAVPGEKAIPGSRAAPDAVVTPGDGAAPGGAAGTPR